MPRTKQYHVSIEANLKIGHKHYPSVTQDTEHRAVDFHTAVYRAVNVLEFGYEYWKDQQEFPQRQEDKDRLKEVKPKDIRSMTIIVEKCN